jgi:probable HAF family extracellular repeat protein
VVGNARTTANVQHAFLWEDGVMIDFNDAISPGSGWVLQSGEAINDRGQISGFGLYHGAVRGFLLTPVH